MKCKRCGAATDPQDNYCRNCGMRLLRAPELPGMPDVYVPSTPSPCNKSGARFRKRLKAAAAALVFFSLAAIVIAKLAPDLIYFSMGGKPRDLGVTYTDKDYQSILGKTGVVADAPPALTDRGAVRDELTGSMDIDWTFTESELTAWMNLDERPGYWPFSSVQIRLHPDNIMEASLSLDPIKLMTFETVSKYLPKEITNFLSGMPSEIPIYAKAKVLFTGAQQVDIQMLGFAASNLPVSGLGTSEEANQILETVLNEVFAQAEGVGITEFSTGEGTMHMKGTWYKEIKRVPVE